jgi:chaperone modulatory protein CbpM
MTMATEDVLIGVVIDDVTLTLEELAHACDIDVQWITERIESEILKRPGEAQADWRFKSIELIRIRRLIDVERDFDAQPELAALVVDLMEELDLRKAQLQAAGLL